ncbi:hypothetical protein ACHAXT_011890 [Thalassiosira profunda]
MAPLSASVLVGTTSLANLSSARHRPPSLAPPRKEGWTEVWGGKECNQDDDGEGKSADSAPERPYLPPRYVTVLTEGCDEIAVRREGGKRRDELKAPALTLTQYRVAYFEQLVLRVCCIPHTVENSGYAAVESTGGLPYLLDTNDGNGSVKTDALPADQPVLVGRTQPGGMGSHFFQQCNAAGLLPSGSHIVDYLRLKHSHRMSNHVLFPEHLKGGKYWGDALAYETLIQEKLNYNLMALRYGCDPAWRGVYQPQCVNATLDPNGVRAAANGGVRRRAFFPLWAWYQAYSERALALHNLMPSTHATHFSTRGGLALELFRYNDHRHPTERKGPESDEGEDDTTEDEEVHQHHPFSSFVPSRAGGGGGDSGKVNVHRAMELAGMYYSALEERLAFTLDANDESGTSRYFLGTEKPTYVDVLLFAHLAEALCDVHLVLVLAKHSRLVKHFQRMHDRFFGKEYAAECAPNNRSGQGTEEVSTDWIQKNDAANALNAFNQIPVATSLKPKAKGPASLGEEGQDMVRAIRLMQQIAVHCHELALRDAAILRMEEGAERAVLESYDRPMGSRLYRWIMGGEVSFWGSGKQKSGDRDEGTNDEGDDDASRSGDEREKEPKMEEDSKQRIYREHVKRMKRDRRTHDELWLSGVVVTVVAALVISAVGKPKK